MELTIQYLSWHDFSVGAADLHPCVEAGSVVGLNDVSTIGLVRADPAIIRPC